MPVAIATITYYCAKSATDIAKLALEYRKIQEIAKLRTELERQKSISESILSYTRLIKSGVQSLMHMYFKSACENLNYALTASGENQKEYLRQARNRFIDATTIEKNENLILSYIGLALCQILTDDNENSTKTISKIKNVVISLPDNIDELGSMMKYPAMEWPLFLARYMMIKIIDKEPADKCFDYACNRAFGCNQNDHFVSEHTLEQMKYYKRMLNALSSCGGYSMNEAENVENNKRAIKKILQEDFEAFKSDILLQFEIN